MITLNYRDARPIYEQVRNGLRRLIVSGAIADGDKLPSVRALASQLAINPNTIQRAYSELESEGYAASVPGKGSFAVRRERAEDDGRRLALTETLRETLRELRALGMTTAELDAIYREEITAAGEDKNINQYFAVLTNTRSVGVMGDGRTYDYTLALRAVTTSDFMTADWARIPYDVLDKISVRIVNQVPGINRIVYDITSKPPATIEWE